jgi:hypothetical protein
MVCIKIVIVASPPSREGAYSRDKYSASVPSSSRRTGSSVVLFSCEEMESERDGL